MSKREAVLEAFLQMIREMTIEEIRTEELLKRAGISKSTFYRLFRDKYEVMNAIYLDVSEKKVQELPSLSHWREWTRTDLAHVKKHQRFFRNIASYTGQNSLREAVKSYYQGNMLREVEKRLPGGQISAKLRFLVEAFAEANAFTLIWWIQNDCRMPEEELLEYIDALIPEALRGFFETPEEGSGNRF